MSDLQLRTWLHPSNAWRAALILLGFLGSLAAAGSYLVYPNPLSPLAVLGVFAAAAIGVVWLRKPEWALYAALFVVLLPPGLISNSLQSNLNRSLTIIALGTWLFNVLSQRYRVIWTSTTLVMLGFLTWGALTLLWTTNLSISTTILQAYTLRLILYLFLVSNEIRTKRTLDRLMHTLAASGWVLVLISIGTAWLEGYTPGTRLGVLEVNENGLGIGALVALPGVLWQTVQPSRRHTALKKLTAFVFLALTAGVVAMSGSRGSIISLLVTLLVFWLWKPTRPWGRLTLILLILAILSAPSLFLTTLERFAVERSDTMLGGREVLWQAAWLLIRGHIWLGVGIGNAPYAIMPYVRLFRSVAEYEWAAIHNPILTIWAETGIPGLLLYLGVLGSAVWSFVRHYLQHRTTDVPWLVPYFALVASVFLGYMASWIKGGGMETGFTYFLMLALLLIPSNIELGAPTREDAKCGQTEGKRLTI